MLIRIHHTTRYAYDGPVEYGLLQFRSTPKSRSRQQVRNWTITVEGGRVEAAFDDQHANRVQLIGVSGDDSDLAIICDGEVEVEDGSGIVGPHKGPSPLWLYRRVTPLTRPGPALRRLAKSVPDASLGDIPRLHQLMARVREAVAYETGMTDASTTAETALEAGHGVCQDHAHIFISIARLLGYPARYVGGYLLMNDRIDQEAGHAWAEAHVDGVGWVGFDASNAISPDERYVRVATGLDYSEAAPVSGMRFGAAGESLAVSIQVQQQ